MQLEDLYKLAGIQQSNTPAIEPDAPIMGTSELKLKKACVSEAKIPDTI